MTQEQIRLYNELKNELYKSAERVAKYFVKLNSSYEFIDSWEIDEDENEVVGNGTETWNYGGFEEHCVYFDTKWLYATDEELQNHVDSILKEEEKIRQEKLEEKHKKAKEQKYQEYLKLKTEFEGE